MRGVSSPTYLEGGGFYKCLTNSKAVKSAFDVDVVEDVVARYLFKDRVSVDKLLVLFGTGDDDGRRLSG